MAHWNFQVYLAKLFHKQVAVFCIHNGLNTGAQHLNAKFLERAVQVKLGATVQSSLSAKSQQNAVGTLLLDNLCDKMSGDWLEINFVGNALRCLDRCNVWIHQYTVNPFLS